MHLKSIFHSSENSKTNDEFLNAYVLPMLNKINIKIDQFTTSEIEVVIKNLPTKKSLWPGWFYTELYTFKEN